MSIGDTRWTHHVGIGYEMALGRYWVHAYLGEQKIGEATFETVPAPKPQSIRGVVTGPEDQPSEEIALNAKRGEEGFWAVAGPDGAFDVGVSSGSFMLEVFMLFGNTWRSVGWYDGKGGITIDSDKAFEVVVNNADIEGIEINISSVSDVDIRGVVTGPDGQPLEGIALQLKQREERFWVDIGPLGTFNIGVPSGSYILEVLVKVGSEYVFVGWYDGNGSITTDPSRAFEVIVDGADVEGISIMLPSVPDTNIRGAVTGPDGQPIEGIVLLAKRGEVSFRVETGPEGAFDILVSSGSFIIELYVQVQEAHAIHYYFVGWYDGSGGITTDPSEALEVIVDDADVEGIEIILPTDTEGLICPSGSYRSTRTGSCV